MIKKIYFLLTICSTIALSLNLNAADEPSFKKRRLLAEHKGRTTEFGLAGLRIWCNGASASQELPKLHEAYSEMQRVHEALEREDMFTINRAVISTDSDDEEDSYQVKGDEKSKPLPIKKRVDELIYEYCQFGCGLWFPERDFRTKSDHDVLIHGYFGHHKKSRPAQMRAIRAADKRQRARNSKRKEKGVGLPEGSQSKEESVLDQPFLSDVRKSSLVKDEDIFGEFE